MILMLWRKFKIKIAVINNCLRYFFLNLKSLLILLPNNLLDYVIEHDDTHNLMNLFFFSLALQRGPFSQINKNRTNFPQKKG